MMLECVVDGGFSIVSKNSPRRKENLEETLVDVSFTCGTPLQDLWEIGKCVCTRHFV